MASVPPGAFDHLLRSPDGTPLEVAQHSVWELEERIDHLLEELMHIRSRAKRLDDEESREELTACLLLLESYRARLLLQQSLVALLEGNY